MLKGIDPLLTPDLLKVLAEMGHGDEIIIADANFTATTLAQGPHGTKPVIRLPGVNVERAAQAVLSLFPLDQMVDQPVAYMQVSGTPEGRPQRPAAQRDRDAGRRWPCQRGTMCGDGTLCVLRPRSQRLRHRLDGRVAALRQLPAQEGCPRRSPCPPDVAHAPHEGSRLRPRGSSQGGLRQYNERVVLQSIRLHGALPGAEIARVTHLTAQTVSMITKRLIEDGLLLKGEPLRGKVGQPSVPLALNPDGAYSVGVKVGRRSLDVLLIDFEGRVRERSTRDYPFPDPDLVLSEIGLRVQGLTRRLGPAGCERLQGIGMAAPLSMGGWQQLLGFPADLAERWHQTDLRAEVEKLTGLPVDLLKGHGRRLRGRTGGRARPQRQDLPLRVCRHLHRRRPGDRQPPAGRPARQRRGHRLAAVGPGPT